MAVNRVDETSVFLEARNVTVAFPIAPHIEMVDAHVGGRIRQVGKRKELVAVDDVSFRLEAGDSLGLRGHNGSGKTTLLRALAGIIYPNKGDVLHHGSVGNALNTSIGFRQEATGRRNIKLKSLIAGVKAKDLPDIVDNVEDFAELGPFLDMPIHTYSAGMRARLAFGVATAFSYDILILDEWLGAGDKRMKDKAAQRMQDFVANSAITVLASHDEVLLRKTCKTIMRMEHGRVIEVNGLPGTSKSRAVTES